MKKRFTEAQIIGFLPEGASGVAIKDLCRRHGFSEASYYLWRGDQMTTHHESAIAVRPCFVSGDGAKEHQ